SPGLLRPLRWLSAPRWPVAPSSSCRSPLDPSGAPRPTPPFPGGRPPPSRLRGGGGLLLPWVTEGLYHRRLTWHCTDTASKALSQVKRGRSACTRTPPCPWPPCIRSG